jgi:hypothetical protein
MMEAVMQRWSYVNRPKAKQPDKRNVENLISDLWRRLRSQKSKGTGTGLKLSVSDGTDLLYETLSACVVALNSDPYDFYSSKRDAEKKLKQAQEDYAVLEKYGVENKILPEKYFDLYGVLDSAPHFIEEASQGPKQDWNVRRTFEALYYDWMILTGTKPFSKDPAGSNKQTGDPPGSFSFDTRANFIAEAWALLFPDESENAELIPARTLRDWEEDLKADGIENDPKWARQMILNFLPKS